MDLDELNAERVTALLEALPPVIRVGAHDIAIARYGRMSQERQYRWAHWAELEQKIYVETFTPTPFLLADAFMHEVWHAFWWGSDMEPQETEERVCSRFGTALVDLHRNNPWLAAWLTMATAPLQKPLAFDVEAAIRAELVLVEQGFLNGTEKPPHCHGLDCQTVEADDHHAMRGGFY